jgi:hypothetical protein
VDNTGHAHFDGHAGDWRVSDAVMDDPGLTD